MAAMVKIVTSTKFKRISEEILLNINKYALVWRYKQCEGRQSAVKRRKIPQYVEDCLIKLKKRG